MMLALLEMTAKGNQDGGSGYGIFLALLAVVLMYYFLTGGKGKGK